MSHDVLVRIWESIMPLDRGERYEDPLAEALSSKGWGEVTGGGTQVTALNEVEFADVELELTNLDDAVELVRLTLEKGGAPRARRFPSSATASGS